MFPARGFTAWPRAVASKFGAGGDHVDGDGNARVVIVAKAGQDAVGIFFSAVGHLFAEGVPVAVDLAQEVDEVK